MKNKETEINLAYHYVRIKDEQVSFDDYATVAAKIANAAVTKKAASAPNKLTKEAKIQVSLKASFINKKNALQNHHACITRTCSNYGRYCWDDDDDHHFPLNFGHFVVWSKAIDKNDASCMTTRFSTTVVEDLWNASKKSKKKTVVI